MSNIEGLRNGQELPKSDFWYRKNGTEAFYQVNPHLLRVAIKNNPYGEDQIEEIIDQCIPSFPDSKIDLNWENIRGVLSCLDGIGSGNTKTQKVEKNGTVTLPFLKIQVGSRELHVSAVPFFTHVQVEGDAGVLMLDDQWPYRLYMGMVPASYSDVDVRPEQIDWKHSNTALSPTIDLDPAVGKVIATLYGNMKDVRRMTTLFPRTLFKQKKPEDPKIIGERYEPGWMKFDN